MLCLALYNVFIIIELSTFISIRGKKRLPDPDGSAITQACLGHPRAPWGFLPPLGSKEGDPRPQALPVLPGKQWKTQGKRREAEGSEATGPRELRAHG